MSREPAQRLYHMSHAEPQGGARDLDGRPLDPRRPLFACWKRTTMRLDHRALFRRKARNVPAGTLRAKSGSSIRNPGNQENEDLFLVSWIPHLLSVPFA